MSRMLAATLTVLVVAPTTAHAAAGDDINGLRGYVDRQGRHFVDDQGRTLEFHGFVLPYKRAPWLITAAGFGEDDAEFLAREGFNLVQLRFTYGGIEPQPGRYDVAYIERVVRTARMLTARGIRVLLQTNQGNYGPATHGHGFPEWATFTDGMPNPDGGFGPNFLLNPALLRAWDHLWANTVTDRGEGIQDGFVKGLREIWSRLGDDPLVLGQDILNEPWLGSRYPTCFPVGRETDAGCPAFDREQLQPFYERVIAALRPLMPRQLFLYEPVPTFDLGLPTYLEKVGGGDPRVAFSFHMYCSLDGGGADLPAAPQGVAKENQCAKEEERIMDNAQAHGEADGVPLLSSEFGASKLAPTTARVIAEQEQRLLSWTYAAYCCRSAKEVGSGDVILDPSKPPTPENVNNDKLAHLVRPYPAALTGTAKSAAYDPGTGRYTLKYATARAGGGDFAAGLASVISVPARAYPSGYDVVVRGARADSAPGARRLRLLTDPGADEVDLTLTRSTAAPYRCASRRVIDVRAPRVPRGATAVRVTATLDGRSLRVRRAGRDHVVRVDLRGRERGAVRVLLVARWRTVGGARVRKVRMSVFRTCTARRGAVR